MPRGGPGGRAACRPTRSSDYNATTRVDPAVLEAMLPYLRERFGNPSSVHEHGVRARAAVELARGEVARLVRADAGEIVFTSGGTEATNHAIKGATFAAFARGQIGQQLVVSAVEHPATQEAARFVERLGFKRVVVAVDRHGVVALDAMERALRAPTLLVSVMHSNNEIGTLQPVAEIAKHTREQGALVHVDAAQSVGKVAVDVETLGVDLLTVAGHKL